jgi:hypothetical protein
VVTVGITIDLEGLFEEPGDLALYLYYYYSRAVLSVHLVGNIFNNEVDNVN